MKPLVGTARTAAAAVPAALSVAVAAVTGFAAVIVAADAAQAGVHRFGVVIGSNRGHDDREALRFAERDAQRVYDVLSELGGFAPGDLRLVVGRDACDAWAAIEEVERRAAAAATASGERTLLLFYFSGHADGEHLELGRSTLDVGQVRRMLETSAATTRLAVIDSCQSGRLVAGKAGRRAPEFQIRVTDELFSSGYAIVTSSADDELSQESEEVRGAFFTHYLVSGLRGAADRSGDGRVTLIEAYEYAYAHTVARTGRTVGGGQHPMYEFRLAGQGELVLTELRVSTAWLEVSLPESGRIIVVDGERQHMVTEAEVTGGRPVVLGVRPGAYYIYYLAGERLRAAPARVSDRSGVQLRDQDFRELALERGIAKGGLFRQPWQPTLAGSVVLRRGPFANGAIAVGAAVQSWVDGPWPVALTMRFLWTTTRDNGAATGSYDLGLAVGAGRRWELGSFSLHADVLGGGEYLVQRTVRGRARYSGGVTYAARIGARARVAKLELGLGAGVGGRTFRVYGQGLVSHLDLQLDGSLAWAW